MIVGHRAFSNSFLVFILTITFAVSTLVLAIGVQAEAPTKQQIAFYSNRDGNFEIYVMDVDGKNPQRLTINPAIDAGPSWSPSGKKIAFHSNRSGDYDIFVMDANGNNQINLTNSADTDDREPDWSPDEENIAYQSKDTGHYDIFIMSANGKNSRNVTNKADSREQHPAWSPDGRAIAFTSNRDGNEDIFVMQPNGNRPRNLTEKDIDGPEGLRLANARDSLPSWTADGKKIVYSSVNSNRVWIMDADGKNRKQIVPKDGNDRDAAVSPDGKFIVFQANRNCGDGCKEYEVFVADITRAQVELKQITFGGHPHGDFDWFDPIYALSVARVGKAVTLWGRIKQGM